MSAFCEGKSLLLISRWQFEMMGSNMGEIQLSKAFYFRSLTSELTTDGRSSPTLQPLSLRSPPLVSYKPERLQHAMWMLSVAIVYADYRRMKGVHK